MGAGANVETVASLDELPAGTLHADIIVVHHERDLAAIVAAAGARAPLSTAIVAVIAKSSLEDVVIALKAGRVSSVMVADHFSSGQLAGVAARLLFGDVFGIEKVVPWGVKVYSILVGDYQEKSVAIAAVSDFAASMGVRRKYRESIDQCLDEMLMNALYDAPVDSAGKQTMAEIPTKTRISLRMEQKAVVQYACDGNFFALSVRDSFGTLKGDTVVKYLDKCLHSAEQIDRKVGGAGLGLYIICNAATEFMVNLHPGLATEATCLFDLTAAMVQLEQFGIFEEKIDASARLFGGAPSRMVTAPAVVGVASSPRGVTALLAAAVALLLALIAVVAWPRLRPTPHGSVSVATDPPGATVEVDGITKGTTGAQPIVVANLEVGQKYKLTARKPGYESAVELISPARGNQTTTVNLTLRALAASLVVQSVPSGATLLVDGKDMGITPVTLATLTPGSDHQGELRKIGYQDQLRTLHIPDPGQAADVQVALSLAPDVSSVSITSDPPGAEITQNGELLVGEKTPLGGHIVAGGRSYVFGLRLAGYMPESRTVTIQPGAPPQPIDVKLRAGGMLSVETNLPDAKLTVLGAGATPCVKTVAGFDCPLPNGSYKLKLVSPGLPVTDTPAADMAGADTKKRVEFGYVTTPEDVTIKLGGAPPNTIHKLALTEGDHQVTVVDKTGAELKKAVHIVAGKTLTLDAK